MQGGIYLRTLAISDTIALCVSGPQMAVTYLFRVELRHENTIFYKEENNVRHFVYIVSSWTIHVCYFSTERTLSLFDPYKSLNWFNKGENQDLSDSNLYSKISPKFIIPYGFVYHISETNETESQAPAAENDLDFVLRKSVNIITTRQYNTKERVYATSRQCLPLRTDITNGLWILFFFL